tara:strand:- start:647 stop:820 length:174 start_codon:yes stop_codon:yes gene_type:complete
MSRFGDLLGGKTPKKVSFDDMSKKELEDYGRTVGIELDRRHSHSRLVQELREHLDNQ